MSCFMSFHPVSVCMFSLVFKRNLVVLRMSSVSPLKFETY